MRILALAAATLSAAAASADVRYYRYSTTDRSGEPRYVGAIPAANLHGEYNRVETDAAGRLIRAEVFRGSRKTSVVAYDYAGTGTLATGFRRFAVTGEQTGVIKITRNDRGERTRLDFYTTQGTLTSYTVRNYKGDEVEAVDYSAAGEKQDRTVSFYSSRGRERAVWYPSNTDGTTYYESEIDTGNGLTKFRRKFTKGELVVIEANSYDADGELLRIDLIDPHGALYGVKEYADGLRTTEAYRFTDGLSEVTKTAYDEKRWAKESTFTVNGNLVCTFRYERLSDGSITRTVAVGPNGELMAEYPSEYVDKVRKDGKPLDADVGVIHKQGDWW